MKGALNENIKRLRLLNGLNQVEFSKRLGITKQCVSNWENDNVMPSVDMLIRLADYFKVSTDYLLGRESKLMIDVSMLSDRQRTHIGLLIDDLCAHNLPERK